MKTRIPKLLASFLLLAGGCVAVLMGMWLNVNLPHLYYAPANFLDYYEPIAKPWHTGLAYFLILSGFAQAVTALVIFIKNSIDHDNA